MTSQLAIAFIKAHEGCKLKAYKDGGGVWTIGYGHTGPEVKEGLTWTQADADRALAFDLGHAEGAVNKLVKVPVGEETTAALSSFVFNLGEQRFKESTLLTLLNGSHYLEAAKEFLKWDHDNGKEVKGLLVRRLEEAVLFLRGV